MYCVGGAYADCCALCLLCHAAPYVTLTEYSALAVVLMQNVHITHTDNIQEHRMLLAVSVASLLQC